jgi:glycosyltransferase involved in cell wall biosynthesis
MSDVMSEAMRAQPVTSESGPVPIAVVLITFNEAHNLAAMLNNIEGFASEIFIVDSYSCDETVDIALAHGVHVTQRNFQGFGDQWNFALRELPISAPWTMKLDPDERLNDELKHSIAQIIEADEADGFAIRRRLWFMGRRLPVIQTILRGWRTGTCRFSDVLVNEHPLVEGKIVSARGELEHHDSPDLHHWFDKQNRYSSAEALNTWRGGNFSASPRLTGTALERRMWLKSHLNRLPLRSLIVFLYCYFWQGAWRAGRIGFTWSRLRTLVYRMRALKILEMKLRGHELHLPPPRTGRPHPGARQASNLCEGPNPG